jgi:hypothetical protein
VGTPHENSIVGAPASSVAWSSFAPNCRTKFAKKFPFVADLTFETALCAVSLSKMNAASEPIAPAFATAMQSSGLV